MFPSRVSRYCVSGHKSIWPTSNIRRGGDRRLQRSGHGWHGTTHLFCGWGGLPHYDQVRGPGCLVVLCLINFLNILSINYTVWDVMVTVSLCKGRRRTSLSSSVGNLAQGKLSLQSSPWDISLWLEEQHSRPVWRREFWLPTQSWR